MSEEYNQRISNIAEEIVGFEEKFNKKVINSSSVIESITKITRKYNKEGKDLILESLEKQAQIMPSEILKSNGEISEAVLTEAVSYAINIASDRGIDIIATPPSNLEKISIDIVNVAITVAIINDMIKNYDNLTLAQKNTISDNLHLLSHEDRLNYFKNKWKQIDTSNLDEDSKQAAKTLNKFNQDLEEQLAELLKAAKGNEQKIIDEFIKEQPNYKKIIAKFIEERNKNTF